MIGVDIAFEDHFHAVGAELGLATGDPGPDEHIGVGVRVTDGGDESGDDRPDLDGEPAGPPAGAHDAASKRKRRPGMF